MRVGLAGVRPANCWVEENLHRQVVYLAGVEQVERDLSETPYVPTDEQRWRAVADAEKLAPMTVAAIRDLERRQVRAALEALPTTWAVVGDYLERDGVLAVLDAREAERAG